MSKDAKYRSAAVLTIFDAPNMTTRGANAIAKWLENQAKFLRKYRAELSNRFVARYLYEKK